MINFASFLSFQLASCEQSIYCALPDYFPDFKRFVIKFLIRMSQDFATRSLIISDESSGQGYSKPVIPERRKWEKSPHPYLFFNQEDGHSLSFCGFRFDNNRNILDETTNTVIERGIMTSELYDSLVQNFAYDNKVVFNASLNQMTNEQKLTLLSRVMGVHRPSDLDKR